MTDKIREKFEKWYNDNHREPIHPADYRTDGDYRLGISGKWNTYQAGYQAANAEANELNDRVRFVLIEANAVLEVLPVELIFRTQIEKLREKLTKATKWLEEGK